MMGKTAFIFTTMLVLSAIVVYGQGKDQSPVVFRDPVLEDIIRHKIDKSEGIIYPEDLKGLTNITFGYVAGIKNISGLEHCSNLKVLRLHDTVEITDISPLSGLINLETLDLRGNRITDISPLSGLANLRYLDLSNNRIKDISPLSGLKNLRDLYLFDNRITDKSSLSGLINLETLGLSTYYMETGLEPLSELKNLNTLYIMSNDLTDLSPLLKLENLSDLKVAPECSM
jgi:internalin A